MGLTRTITFNLTATLTGNIVVEEAPSGPQAGPIEVWSGGTRPPDGNESSGTTFDLGPEFAGFAAIWSDLADVTFSFGPPDENGDAGGHIVNVVNNGTVQMNLSDYVNPSNDSSVLTPFDVANRLGVGVIRTTSGTRVYITDGNDVYSGLIPSFPTSEKGYSSISATYSDEYEWWSGGPVVDDQGNDVVITWLLANV